MASALILLVNLLGVSLYTVMWLMIGHKLFEKLNDYKTAILIAGGGFFVFIPLLMNILGYIKGLIR
jgi:hypothetical protein